jgi:hypothetical protein
MSEDLVSYSAKEIHDRKDAYPNYVEEVPKESEAQQPPAESGCYALPGKLQESYQHP